MREWRRFVFEFLRLFWRTRAVLLSFLFLIVVGGFLIWLVEPINFGESIYLAFITALTIGYGDFVPTTPLAQIIAILIGCVGMIFMGLTVGIASIAVRKAVGLVE